jgi:hypothetical protein
MDIAELRLNQPGYIHFPGGEPLQAPFEAGYLGANQLSAFNQTGLRTTHLIGKQW